MTRFAWRRQPWHWVRYSALGAGQRRADDTEAVAIAELDGRADGTVGSALALPSGVVTDDEDEGFRGHRHVDSQSAAAAHADERDG